MSGCHAQGIIQELNQGMFQDKTFIHLYNEKVKTLKLSIKVMNGVKSRNKFSLIPIGHLPNLLQFIFCMSPISSINKVQRHDIC